MLSVARTLRLFARTWHNIRTLITTGMVQPSPITEYSKCGFDTKVGGNPELTSAVFLA